MAEAKKPAANKAAPKKKELQEAEATVVAEVTEKVAEMVETEAIAEAIVEAEAEIAAEEKAVKTTKAGKHSAKGLKEAEEKAAKEERKAHASEIKAEETAKPKIVIKSRSRLERQGKKFRAASEQIDKTKEYALKDALELAAKTSPVKFDATVELHIKLGVDPRHADQNIRANLVLPAGTGKKVTVAVFADTDDIAVAKKAGADIAGSDDFLQQLDKGVINFDVLVATPAMMPKLGKYARVLGPKGLMPSPKSGTVTTDVAKAVSEAKAGRVEYRVDSTAIVHLGVGKVSFGADKLEQNAKAVLASIRSAKPASIKGNYVQSVFVTTSMGPSVRVMVSEV